MDTMTAGVQPRFLFFWCKYLVVEEIHKENLLSQNLLQTDTHKQLAEHNFLQHIHTSNDIRLPGQNSIPLTRNMMMKFLLGHKEKFYETHIYKEPTTKLNKQTINTNNRL